MNNKKVAVIMGSDSDMELVKPAIEQLNFFEIETEVLIISAHRSANFAIKFAKSAKLKNFGVIIAAASLSAHLAGVLASHTIIPVIGLPLQSILMGGLDSLLSTVQMPAGVPVATVAINGAKNAAILAAQILAINNSFIANKLENLKIQMEETILKKNKNLKTQ